MNGRKYMGKWGFSPYVRHVLGEPLPYLSDQGPMVAATNSWQGDKVILNLGMKSYPGYIGIII